MQKLERVFHNETFIGSIITRNGFVYGFQAHAKRGDLPHYSGTDKDDCEKWLTYMHMRNRQSYPVSYDYICPQPRFPS